MTDSECCFCEPISVARNVTSVHRLSIQGFRHCRYSDGSRKRKFFHGQLSLLLSSRGSDTRIRTSQSARKIVHGGFTRPEFSRARTSPSARSNHTRTSHCFSRRNKTRTSHCGETKPGLTVCAGNTKFAPARSARTTQTEIRTALRARESQHNTMREVSLDEEQRTHTAQRARTQTCSWQNLPSGNGAIFQDRSTTPKRMTIYDATRSTFPDGSKKKRTALEPVLRSQQGMRLYNSAPTRDRKSQNCDQGHATEKFFNCSHNPL